jgi:parallel beta-helix repeat protein
VKENLWVKKFLEVGRSRRLLVTLTLTAILALSIGSTAVQSVGAHATTWHVHPGQKIQTTLDSASARDTIIVDRGEYHQSVVIKKSISLVGDGAILDGNPPADSYLAPDAVTIAGGVSGVTIKQFEIRYYSNGIQASNGDTRNVKVIGNVIHDTDTAINVGNDGAGLHQNWFIAENTLLNNGYGIHLSGENAVISNNIVKQFGTYGIYVQGEDIVISKNTVEESKGYFSGIFVGRTGEDERDSRHITIIGNVVTNAPTGMLLVTEAKEAQLDDIKIMSNKVSQCGNGIVVEKLASFSGPITSVVISGNQVDNNAYVGIVLQLVIYANVAGNRVNDNGHSGIEVTSGSSHIEVTMNLIVHNGRYGIEIAGSDYNKVTGNTVKANGWSKPEISAGIALDSTSDYNVVTLNLAKGNVQFDLYYDGTGMGNVWKLNTYDTKNW